MFYRGLSFISCRKHAETRGTKNSRQNSAVKTRDFQLRHKVLDRLAYRFVIFENARILLQRAKYTCALGVMNVYGKLGFSNIG